MKILLILIGIVIAVVIVGWLGLQIPPASFPAYPQPAPGSIQSRIRSQSRP